MSDERDVVMRLHFDPMANPTLRKVFENDVARTLYLAWRRSHNVDQDFPSYCLSIAEAFRRLEPKSVEDFTKCFPGLADPYFTEGDVWNFCKSDWGFFTGERRITFVVIGPAAEHTSHNV